ncbi:MAG: MFS transporter [Candidatus Heimdallarchaeaceae archaeon]
MKDLADIEYGYIGAVIVLGSIIGNLSFGALEKFIGRPIAIFLGSVAIASYYFAFLFQPGFIAILIIGFVMGVLNGMFSLAINALFAENVPNEVRGRAYSVVNAYIQVFTVICYSVSGITADTIGVVITMAGSGIFLLVTTAFITIFTKFYRFANVKPQNATSASK